MCSKQTYPKIILKKGNYDIRQKKKEKKEKSLSTVAPQTFLTFPLS